MICMKGIFLLLDFHEMAVETVVDSHRSQYCLEVLRVDF